MKVILRQTVPKLGKENSVVHVADGYARNYLFPRGLAILADKTQVQVLERRMAKLADKLASQKSSMADLGASLNGKAVKIEGQVGKDSTKLFGAITSQDVVDAIAKQLGQKLDKRQIALIEPIKRLGRHEVELDLHREVDAKVFVDVFDPNAVEEAAPEAVAEPVVETTSEETPEEA